MEQNIIREIDTLSLELAKATTLFDHAVRHRDVAAAKALDMLCEEKELEIESLESRLKELHQDDELDRSHAR